MDSLDLIGRNRLQLQERRGVEGEKKRGGKKVGREKVNKNVHVSGSSPSPKY